ncbi:high mobility group B protein 10-like [Lycium ferocissimum]|uniref:high mobility group B protein 10-like n=1 Tax=Lycium ferocissimum TaxID=112874 RepID=UPI002814CFC4|nr:high mobility group B protein 10-like [Lycium ferocissimum]
MGSCYSGSLTHSLVFICFFCSSEVVESDFEKKKLKMESSCADQNSLKLHASMRTMFRIPTIEGKMLDLHLLFVQGTSRGGIKKVYSDFATLGSLGPDKEHLKILRYNLHLPEIEAAMPQQPQRIVTTFLEAPSIVFGFVDGKFESEYLITVKIGSEDFKGVLYHGPMN